MGCASEQRLLVVAVVSMACPSSWNGSQDRSSLYCAEAMTTYRTPTMNMEDTHIINCHMICYIGLCSKIFFALEDGGTNYV